VAPASFGESDDKTTEVGTRKPLGHSVTEHTATLPLPKALARNDEDETGATRLRAAEEGDEGRERPLLPHSVQVEAGVHLRQAARQAAERPILQRRKQRRVGRQ
jgi:hypothetical protein